MYDGLLQEAPLLDYELFELDDLADSSKGLTPLYASNYPTQSVAQAHHSERVSLVQRIVNRLLNICSSSSSPKPQFEPPMPPEPEKQWCGDDVPTTAPSPQTVVDPLATALETPSHTAVCQRPPSNNANHRLLLNRAVLLLNNAFKNIAKTDMFGGDDIVDDGRKWGERFAFEHPLQDGYGALGAAVTVARYLLHENMMSEHGLDINTRVLLATILFMCFKLKSEISYRHGDGAQLAVVAHFLTPEELPPASRFMLGDVVDTRQTFADAMWRLEGEILRSQPVFELVDNNTSVGTELALTDMLAASLLTRRQACIILASANFFLNASVMNPKIDLLEDLGRELTAPRIGMAVALIGATALLDDVPRAFADYPLLVAASRFVKNASDLGDEVRDGAYLDSRSPTWAVVGKNVLPRVQAHIDAALGDISLM